MATRKPASVPSTIATPAVQAEYFKALQAEIAKLKSQIAAPPAETVQTVTVGAKSPRGKAALKSQPTADVNVLAKVMAKYAADNGHGPHTFNVNYTVKKPAGLDGAFRMLIQTADGPKAVPPTIHTIIGAAFGVSDFRQTPTFSGKSLVWTSQDTLKRIAAAGYVVTTRGKLTTAEVARNRGAADATPANVVDASSLL